MLPIDQVEFVKELYPRLREDDAAIERYRESLDKLPPIVVARGRVLVDGFHRWQAHRREKVAELEAVDLGNLTDSEIIRESITRNASHGQQLSSKDKARLAGMLWPTLDKETRVAELAALLSVSDRSVRAWTKDARKVEKDEQRAKAWDMWLDCHTQEAIADELEVSQPTVREWIIDFGNSSEIYNPPESRQHFDLWPVWTVNDNSSYFGKMPPQIVENLLWFYTEPGDTIVDPFAGGGTTIDVAKAMGRRVWTSDLHPSTPTLPIHQHDITTGWPDDAPTKANLILLDPPYWRQAAGKYSDSEHDLGNQTLDEFLTSWNTVVKACQPHLADGGKLAYIVSPAEDKDNNRVVDLALLMYDACRNAGLDPLRRIIVPYNTQQATGQQVEWARDGKRMLKLYRDLVVME